MSGREEKGRRADLEGRVGLALAKEITSRDDAGIDVLCEVEVDYSETWVSGSIWVTSDHTLRGWVGEQSDGKDRERGTCMTMNFARQSPSSPLSLPTLIWMTNLSVFSHTTLCSLSLTNEVIPFAGE